MADNINSLSLDFHDSPEYVPLDATHFLNGKIRELRRTAERNWIEYQNYLYEAEKVETAINNVKAEIKNLEEAVNSLGGEVPEFQPSFSKSTAESSGNTRYFLPEDFFE